MEGASLSEEPQRAANRAIRGIDRKEIKSVLLRTFFIS